MNVGKQTIIRIIIGKQVAGKINFLSTRTKYLGLHAKPLKPIQIALLRKIIENYHDRLFYVKARRRKCQRERKEKGKINDESLVIVSKFNDRKNENKLSVLISLREICCFVDDVGGMKGF